MSINFSDGLEDQQIVTSSSVLPEDSGEGSLRPRTIIEYIGQEKAKDNLSVFIDAARLRNEPLDHVLLHVTVIPRHKTNRENLTIIVGHYLVQLEVPTEIPYKTLHLVEVVEYFT